MTKTGTNRISNTIEPIKGALVEYTCHKKPPKKEPIISPKLVKKELKPRNFPRCSLLKLEMIFTNKRAIVIDKNSLQVSNREYTSTLFVSTNKYVIKAFRIEQVVRAMRKLILSKLLPIFEPKIILTKPTGM